MSFKDTFLKKKAKTRIIEVDNELVLRAVEQYLWAQRLTNANEEVIEVSETDTKFSIHLKETKD